MAAPTTYTPVVLEPASLAFVEATATPPFLYELTPTADPPAEQGKRIRQVPHAAVHLPILRAKEDHMMLVPMRVIALRIEPNARIGGKCVLTAQPLAGGVIVTREPNITSHYRARTWTSSARPRRGAVAGVRRPDERRSGSTNGRCRSRRASARSASPIRTRHAAEVARERAIAAFGKGRC